MPTRRLMGTATSSSVPDNGGDHSGGGGSAGGSVDNVFSTYLYEGAGTGSNLNIATGIDLSKSSSVDENGGLVWIKGRETSSKHCLFDTERGAGECLSCSENSASTWGALSAFNADGFTIYAGAPDLAINEQDKNYTSWTFRKAKNFFDVVTYTGQDGHTQPHNLGAVPGMIIIKNTNTTRNWIVWHRDVTGHLWLNDPRETQPFEGITNVTDKSFDLADWTDVSNVGQEYVAYVFAHDDSDESMIKCGSYIGNGQVNGTWLNDIELGWEPQWLLVKNASSSGGWYIQDTMRGFGSASSTQFWLQAESSKAEAGPGSNVLVTATGFRAQQNSAGFNQVNEQYIYMAIRRPNKPAEEFEPEELFAVAAGSGSREGPNFISGFPVDMFFYKYPANVGNVGIGSRLTQGNLLVTNTTGSESTSSDLRFDYPDGVMEGGYGGTAMSWMFRRAPGFFDVVAYEGGSGLLEVPHNLGVAPELLITKSRNNTTPWNSWYKDFTNSEYINLNTSAGVVNSGINLWGADGTAATDSVFKVSPGTGVNMGPGAKHIAYLFASVPGVSKVGSYTGTGAEIDVDCGFTTGARFVLIKRTDSSGDWYFWDTERGITTGNDPYLLLNTTDAQVTNTDYIDPLSSGFKVTASAPDAINASGGNYIFYAIA